MPRALAASISLDAKLCCELPHGGNYRGIRKGFGFFVPFFTQALTSTRTARKHIERRNRLYEHQITKKATSKEMALALGDYTKRWHSCAQRD